MRISRRRPVLASQRSFDESSADRSDVGTAPLVELLRFQGPFSGAGSGCRAGEKGRLWMCGIIGYVGSRASKPLLLAGLQRLEYRGYDSAGIALLEADGLEYVRAVGTLQNLKDAAESNLSASTTGLGHTRWATHGGVTELNAHPLTACDDRDLAIVLNGIVENFRELREELTEGGHTLT